MLKLKEKLGIKRLKKKNEMATAPEISEQAPPRNDEMIHDEDQDDKTCRADNTTGLVRIESYMEKSNRLGFLWTLKEFIFPKIKPIPFGRFLFLFFFASIP